MSDIPTDPALADHLTEIREMLKEIGAEETWILRQAKDATITFTVADDLPTELPNARVSLGATLPLPDAGLFLVARFPASDGGEPGAEKR